MVAAGIGGDDAGIDGKAFALDQTGFHACTNHRLEDLPEKIALAETAMPVLGEARVIWNRIVQVEAAEPSVSQIERHLLAQPPLGADAVAIADDEHADHQLRINRGPAGRAVIRRQLLVQASEDGGDDGVDLA